MPSTDATMQALGSGKGFPYIAAHQISESLGETKSSALLGFHSFTGCDTVSAFFGRGKKSAWETWKTFPEATDGFVAIGSYPPIITDDIIARLERFVVLCCMTAPVGRTVWTNAACICSPARPEGSTTFLLLRLHSSNKSNGPHSKLAIFGDNLWFKIQLEYQLNCGDGRLLQLGFGDQCGRNSK